MTDKTKLFKMFKDVIPFEQGTMHPDRNLVDAAALCYKYRLLHKWQPDGTSGAKSPDDYIVRWSQDERPVTLSREQFHVACLKKLAEYAATLSQAEPEPEPELEPEPEPEPGLESEPEEE